MIFYTSHSPNIKLSRKELNMSFSIDIVDDTDYYSTNLTYNSPSGTEIISSPDDDSHITTIDCEAEHGCFDMNACNGSFSFSWSPTYLYWEASRYGDGCGGSVSVCEPNTPEKMESLRVCLRKWKAFDEEFSQRDQK
jgi:hypothetical protein